MYSEVLPPSLKVFLSSKIVFGDRSRNSALPIFQKDLKVKVAAAPSLTNSATHALNFAFSADIDKKEECLIAKTSNHARNRC